MGEELFAFLAKLMQKRDRDHAQAHTLFYRTSTRDKRYCIIFNLIFATVPLSLQLSYRYKTSQFLHPSFMSAAIGRQQAAARSFILGSAKVANEVPVDCKDLFSLYIPYKLDSRWVAFIVCIHNLTAVPSRANEVMYYYDPTNEPQVDALVAVTAKQQMRQAYTAITEVVRCIFYREGLPEITIPSFDQACMIADDGQSTIIPPTRCAADSAFHVLKWFDHFYSHVPLIYDDNDIDNMRSNLCFAVLDGG